MASQDAQFAKYLRDTPEYLNGVAMYDGGYSKRCSAFNPSASAIS